MPRQIDLSLNPVQRAFIDDGVYEISKIPDVPHLHRSQLIQNGFSDGVPNGLWNISSRRSRALLPLVLEGPSHQGRCQCLDICRSMSKNKILATGLTHQPWVGPIVRDILPDRFPNGPKSCRRPCKMNPCKILLWGAKSAPQAVRRRRLN